MQGFKSKTKTKDKMQSLCRLPAVGTVCQQSAKAFAVCKVGHVAPSCAIWQQLGDHLVIMPSAGRRQRLTFADCWQRAKYMEG